MSSFKMFNANSNSMQKNWQKDKELECDLKKKCYSKQQNQRGAKQQETKKLRNKFFYTVKHEFWILAWRVIQ